MLAEKIGSYSLLIEGFRDAHISDSEKVLRQLRESIDGVELQLLRADRVAGKEHLVFAARNALDSFKGKERRAKHLSMELLLYASGEHQIIEAINLLGVSSSSDELVVVGLSEKPPEPEQFRDTVAKIVRGTPDDTVVDVRTPAKINGLKRAYKISARELNASRMPDEYETSTIQRLIIERSALLALEN